MPTAKDFVNSAALTLHRHKMKYICPVCGFDELQEPPKSWSLCPCCLTEFEASDASWTHAELRQDWIDAGARWGASDVPKPRNWSPVAQLRNIGYDCALADLQKINGPQTALHSERLAAAKH